MLVSVVGRSQRRGPADAARLCCPTERVWAGGGDDGGVADESAEPEMTYDAAAGWVLPDLRDLVPVGGRVEQLTVQWDSVYFDTEQHDLLAHGVTLRCHTGRIDAGWQLTVPDGDGRKTIRVDPTGSPTTVPKDLAAQVAGVRRGRPLRHIVTVHTDRAAHRLITADNRVAVEVADDRVEAVAPGRRAATLTSWRQVQVAPGPAGDRDLCTAVGSRLARSGATPSAGPDTVARALGVTTVASAAVPAGRTAGSVIGRYLAEQDDALIAGDLTLRRGLGGIHPTRVATRRLRSTLRVYAEFVDTQRARAFDADLAWYAGLLGQVRDREVQRARFAAAVAALPAEQVLGPVAARIEQDLLTEQLRHQKTLDRAMTGKRYFALLAESRRWVTDPPFTPMAAKKPAKLRAAVRDANRAVTKHLTAGLAEGGGDAELHRARKAGKRARYAAELARPVLGKKNATKSARRYQELQDILGEHQDAIVAADLLRRIAAGTAGHPDENGFTYGLLYARELDRADHTRRLAAHWDHTTATH